MIENLAAAIHPVYALIVILFGLLLGYLGWRLTVRRDGRRLAREIAGLNDPMSLMR